MLSGHVVSEKVQEKASNDICDDERNGGTDSAKHEARDRLAGVVLALGRGRHRFVHCVRGNLVEREPV